MRVDEIQLRIVDGCLVGADSPFQLVCRSLLGVHLLLRHRSGIVQQTFEALVVQSRIFKLRLIARQAGPGLVESHLERPRIDDRQQVALIYVLPFFEIDLRQLSVHPAFYGNRVRGGHAAQALQIHRDVPQLGGRNRHRHHRLGRGPRCASLGTSTATGDESGCNSQDEKGKKLLAR